MLSCSKLDDTQMKMTITSKFRVSHLHGDYWVSIVFVCAVNDTEMRQLHASLFVKLMELTKNERIFLLFEDIAHRARPRIATHGKEHSANIKGKTFGVCVRWARINLLICCKLFGHFQ